MAREHELAFLKQLRQARGAKAAWSFFLQTYSGVILQGIREFESDYDSVHDRYLFVCQKLAERDFKRLLSFKRGGEREFAAWLRAVTRNLCIDYQRSQVGRRRLPTVIARLLELDQEVFEGVYWRGLSALETYHDLHSQQPQLEFSQVLESLERIQNTIRPWKLAATARARVERSNPTGSAESLLAEVADTRSSAEDDLLLQETLSTLGKAVAELAEFDRLLLRLRFEMGLTLQAVAAASGLGDHRKAHEHLARILETLRQRLTELGWGNS